MARLRVPASPSPKKAVKAVSPSVKSAKEPRQRSNVIANPRPAYNPRATGPTCKDNGEYASKLDPSMAPRMSTPVKGKAQVLSTISRTANKDMESYVTGDVEAVEKDAHEYIEPTGSKSVFFLQQEDPVTPPFPINAATEAAFEELVNDDNDDNDGDRPWRGIIEFKKEVAKAGIQSSPSSDDPEDSSVDLSSIEEKTETGNQEPESPETPPGVRLMRTKAAPTLALAMARAKLIQDDAVSDSVSDEEDSPEGTNNKMERKLFAFADSSTENQDEDEDIIQRTPPSAMAGRSPSQSSSRWPSVSPPSAIDIPFPRPFSRRSTSSGSGADLRGHSGSESLASLIARAQDLSSSPEGSPSAPPERSPPISSSPVASPSPSPSPSPKAPVFKFFRGPCYDPDFPGHSPCATHDYDPPFGRSVDDALEVFLDWFEVEHCSTSSADYFRGWQDAKYELGHNMVPGSSRLREVMSVEDDKQTPEAVKKFEVYRDEVDDAPPSSPLPVISSDEVDNEMDSSSSFEEDVSGMAANTSEEPAASGFGSDDNVSVSSLEIDSSAIGSTALQTPPGQVVPDDEVLGDYDSAFDSGVAAWVEHERHDRVASATHRRIQMFDNALEEPVSSSSPFEIPPGEHERSQTAAQRVRPTPSKSTLAMSSIRASIFSKATNGTSLNTKSSYETSRPQTARSEAPRNVYSRLMDALDLEINEHKCKEGCEVCGHTMRGFSVASIAPAGKHVRRVFEGVTKNRRRIVSLPVVPSERSELRLGDADNDSAAVIAAVNGVSQHRSPERMRRILGVPDTPDRIGPEIDNMLSFMDESTLIEEQVEEPAQPSIPLPAIIDDDDEPIIILVEQPRLQSPPPELVHEGDDDVFVDMDIFVDQDQEDWAPTSDMIRRAGRRHRWTTKVKEGLKSIPAKIERAPQKVQQKAHEAVKDVKQFSKTVKGFVPAVLGVKEGWKVLGRIL